MFIGRERELKKLNEMYNSDKFEFAIIYGRRRVGKTFLIQEFIKNKKAIFYTALESNDKTNLENFSKSIFYLSMAGISSAPGFQDFQTALDYLHELSTTDRIILVIDEFPYLAKSYREISSILQVQIDHKFIDSKLFLILCGSSMSFMENQVLGYQSPLYGRRTAQFKLLPFDYLESGCFHPDYDLYDNAIIYGITGGIPLYLSQINSKKSVGENIVEHFFSPDSFMFEETSNLLKQELREPQVYNGLITAIATGSSRLNEIAIKTGMETAVCGKYLASLISLGIIKKEKPVLSDSSKRTIYRLADNMFRFWYRFIPQNASQIYAGGGARVYENIGHQISTYMGEVFEEICKQYLWKENIAERLPFWFQEAGRWWGNNPKMKSEQEIDIIAYDDINAIFCECKWTNTPVGRDVLDGLIEKSFMFYHNVKYYFLFSKSGYTAECEQHAILLNENTPVSNYIKLISFKDMA